MNVQVVPHFRLSRNRTSSATSWILSVVLCRKDLQEMVCIDLIWDWGETGSCLTSAFQEAEHLQQQVGSCQKYFDGKISRDGGVLISSGIGEETGVSNNLGRMLVFVIRATARNAQVLRLSRSRMSLATSWIMSEILARKISRNGAIDLMWDLKLGCPII
ncbi:hypothetical protein CEXT_144791 [Caerostris extrusa]|uniref:Uncharacterized protein n=1 Tax=Caerostris extrusa TaxID=172846 RepID=A0AAV4X1S5_CAEEX|nr:hypothetical protein CEXT_144791 [Caerostris extrusa]